MTWKTLAKELHKLWEDCDHVQHLAGNQDAAFRRVVEVLVARAKEAWSERPEG
jgi:hypothetical protein